jgi:lipid A 3-O-deacylase
MHKFFLIQFLASLFATCAMAQTEAAPIFSREFSFTTENDAYLFRKNDAYYTNGFFFALKTAKEKHGKKTIKGWELAQKIFTPLIRKTSGPADIDRPYCGYLFLKFSETRFFANNDDVLQYNAGIGQVGSASFGESVQNGYHDLLDYGRFTGWKYQVQNALGLDAGLTYAHVLWQDSSWIKLMPVAQANLGMNYTNANIGAYICLGSFERNANSAIWGARTQTQQVNTRKKHEVFFYAYPQVVLQGYNSTVQGGLFSKGSGAVLKDPERLMVQYSFGLIYAEDRWTTNIAFVHQSEEATTQTRPQQYASLMLSYRFR